MKADSSTYCCLPKTLFFLTSIQTSHKKRPVLVMDTSFASLGCPLRASLVPIFSWMYNTIPVYPFTILQFFIASSSCIADLFYNGNIQEITGMWVNYQEFWYSLYASSWWMVSVDWSCHNNNKKIVVKYSIFFKRLLFIYRIKILWHCCMLYYTWIGIWNTIY